MDNTPLVATPVNIEPSAPNIYDGGGDYSLQTQRTSTQFVQVQPSGYNAAPAGGSGMATTTTTLWPSWKEMPCSQLAATYANADFGLAGKPLAPGGLINQMDSHGASITQLATSSMQTMESGLDYESLVAGFMTMGETKSADAQMLAFDSVEMWAYSDGGTRPSTFTQSSSGKALITNQRLLFLSCNPSSEASVIQEKKPANGGQCGQYILSYKASNSVWYHPVPLKNFRSVEMLMDSGAVGTAHLKKTCNDMGALQKCFLCLTCGCCDQCVGNAYSGNDFMSQQNKRFIELNYEGTAWGDKRVLRINIGAMVPLVDIQQWTKKLQEGCPIIMGQANTMQR